MFPISERRAYRVIEIPSSSQRYQLWDVDRETRLIKRMIELARQYGRYGYRWITALLRREGRGVNHKQVEGI
jgi:putative transposase